MRLSVCVPTSHRRWSRLVARSTPLALLATSGRPKLPSAASIGPEPAQGEPLTTEEDQPPLWVVERARFALVGLLGAGRMARRNSVSARARWPGRRNPVVAPGTGTDRAQLVLIVAPEEAWLGSASAPPALELRVGGRPLHRPTEAQRPRRHPYGRAGAEQGGTIDETVQWVTDPSHQSRRQSMYIGLGTLVVILIVVLIIYFVRRA
jgi:hypothetical protein